MRWNHDAINFKGLVLKSRLVEDVEVPVQNVHRKVAA